MTVFIAKRIYEPADLGDGYRVLVDRLWPRGISKERAALDQWAKNIAPSAELRKWCRLYSARTEDNEAMVLQEYLSSQ